MSTSLQTRATPPVPPHSPRRAAIGITLKRAPVDEALPRLREPKPTATRCTTAQICRWTDASFMAVVAWRKGSHLREPLLPIIYKFGNGRRVMFDKATVRNWLTVYRPDLVEKWDSHVESSQR